MYKMIDLAPVVRREIEAMKPQQVEVKANYSNLVFVLAFILTVLTSIIVSL